MKKDITKKFLSFVKKGKKCAKGGLTTPGKYFRGKTKTEAIDDAVKLLLDQFSGRKEKLVEFSVDHGYEVAVSCNVTIYEDRPLYELTPATLQILVHLNASFLMDIFDYSED